jgi:Na+-translocating ferredoxin:NAD+ oxidoreductase RnfG subunit
MQKTITLIFLCLFSLSAWAKGVYQKPSQFVAEAFDQAAPAPQLYNYNASDLVAISSIQANQTSSGRTRYWQQDGKTVWVLSRTGKTKPITAGFIIENGKILRSKVLIFKESRGWEVRFKYFTDQFIDAVIKDDYKLDRNIDNISGATLSVRAMQKMARIALYLDQQVADNDDSKPQSQNNEKAQETTQ